MNFFKYRMILVVKLSSTVKSVDSRSEFIYYPRSQNLAPLEDIARPTYLHISVSSDNLSQKSFDVVQII